MMSALDSAIGFPRRPTSAPSMLGLLMPEEVRRSFMRPPGIAAAGENALGAYGCVRGGDWQTTDNSSPSGHNQPHLLRGRSRTLARVSASAFRRPAGWPGHR